MRLAGNTGAMAAEGQLQRKPGEQMLISRQSGRLARIAVEADPLVGQRFAILAFHSAADPLLADHLAHSSAILRTSRPRNRKMGSAKRENRASGSARHREG
ncbi:hypothetical protein ACIBQ1_08560 [Nonomuraea sp. NPDC050153]|uniref:hypothetical protein n=1 Tax=Nonomuraea sp. NPDC050153 TaxID=3364359 RepID=UPI00379F90B8